MAAAGMSLDGTQESWQCKGCRTYNFASRTVCRTCSVIRWPAAVVLTAGSATAKTQFPKNSTQTRSYANGGKAGPREGPKRAKGKEGKGYGQPSAAEEQPSDKAKLNRLQQIRTSLQQAGASTAALSTLDADIRSLRETMEDTRSLDEQLAGITGAIQRTERRAQAARDAIAAAQSELQKEEELLAQYRRTLATVQCRIRSEAGIQQVFQPAVREVPPWIPDSLQDIAHWVRGAAHTETKPEEVASYLEYLRRSLTGSEEQPALTPLPPKATIPHHWCERRRGPNGRLYSRAEFQSWYGAEAGDEIWDAAMDFDLAESNKRQAMEEPLEVSSQTDSETMSTEETKEEDKDPAFIPVTRRTRLRAKREVDRLSPYAPETPQLMQPGSTIAAAPPLAARISGA